LHLIIEQQIDYEYMSLPSQGRQTFAAMKTLNAICCNSYLPFTCFVFVPSNNIGAAIAMDE